VDGRVANIAGAKTWLGSVLIVGYLTELTSEYDVVDATYVFGNNVVTSLRLARRRVDMAAKHIYAIHRVRDDWG